MKRIKKLFVVVHIVLWILLSALVGFQLSSEGDANWIALTFGFIVTALYIFYGHFFLLTRYSGKRKNGGYFFRLAVIIFTGPLLFSFSHYKTLANWSDFIGFYGMGLIGIVTIFIFLSWLARVTENLVLNTIIKEQLEKQAVAAELNNLKSQINPHFLFNTLNNIHTLVYKQAPAAPEAVMRLASLMRYMIYESNAPLVPLSRELNYLKDYISLQQLRYKNAPVVDFEITGDTNSCNIAPLLFIHILENAYKHSPAKLEAGDIKVNATFLQNTLTFSIQNPVNEKRGNILEDRPGGIGLLNVRKRLAILYPDQHQLEISNTGQIFTTTLKISGFCPIDHERKTHLLYHR